MYKEHTCPRYHLSLCLGFASQKGVVQSPMCSESFLPEQSNLDNSGSGACEIYMKFIQNLKVSFLTADFNFPSHQAISETQREMEYLDMRFPPLLSFDKLFGIGY